MISLNRRTLLTLLPLLTLIPRLTRAVQSTPISSQDFLRLSERLTRRNNLDGKTADIYRNALIAAPANLPLLADLARTNRAASTLSPAHVALENTILENWYTGVYALNGEKRVATYAGALMWNALGIPAPGACRGTFGFWARPPQGRA